MAGRGEKWSGKGRGGEGVTRGSGKGVTRGRRRKGMTRGRWEGSGKGRRGEGD